MNIFPSTLVINFDRKLRLRMNDRSDVENVIFFDIMEKNGHVSLRRIYAPFREEPQPPTFASATNSTHFVPTTRDPLSRMWGNVLRVYHRTQNTPQSSTRSATVSTTCLNNATCLINSHVVHVDKIWVGRNFNITYNS